MPIYLVTERFWENDRLIAEVDFGIEAESYEAAVTVLRECMPQLGGKITSDPGRSIRFKIGRQGFGLMSPDPLRMVAEIMADSADS